MSAQATSSDALDGLFAALERELRAAGRLSFATCELLRRDDRLAGFEACVAVLGAVSFAPDPDGEPPARRSRVRMCRLLLLALGAHTDAPCTTPLQLERALEAAQQVPGAELSDVVHALFALLAETTGPISELQTRFIDELAASVAAKRRAGHTVEDFVWIAVRLADPILPITDAQAYLASQTLPRGLHHHARAGLLRTVAK